MAKKQEEVTGWVGWVGFAATMLLIVGAIHIIAGFAALFKDDIYLSTQNALWVMDYSQWGWIHIFGGILAVLAAGSLAQGNMYGRVIATLVAIGSLLTNIVFLSIYPLWSLIMIVISILVIWAVTVHGKEVKNLE